MSDARPADLWGSRLSHLPEPLNHSVDGALSSYLPIEDYGIIGNCRTAALVSRAGSIDWCCFPHFDSQAFFASILDRERGGAFSISPVQPYRSEQHYLEDTNVLGTTFTTSSGEARLLDCFSVSSEKAKHGRLWPNHEILRIVEGIAGEVEMALHYQPRAGYGKIAVRVVRRGKLGITASNGRNLLVLQSDLPEKALGIQDPRDPGKGFAARATFVVHAGSRNTLSLVYDNQAPAVIPPLGPEAITRYEETVAYWKTWIAGCSYRERYAPAVRRSALALKLLTFAPSGAVIAAPTTSLPERVGGVRNWDYRYCWLRDAALTTRALSSLGFYEEATAFVSWLLESTRLSWPRLQVLYSVYGERKLKETALPWLEGYRKSAPVRVGNGAAGQIQLDIYGEVLSAVWQLAEHLRFDGETRHFILGLGKAVRELWQKPDDGIWEVRSGRVHHTHSKVMAWVAMDRLGKLVSRFDWKAPRGEYVSVAEAIRSSVEAQGFNRELGTYVRSFGGKELDASLLTFPLFGYCEANNPRMLGTRSAILKGLSTQGLLYRYNQVNDGLPGHEGSFGICNFWLIENFARAGDLAHARHWFRGVVARQNQLGLWSEEIDPDTNAFLGNYPQGFTHIGLINAATTLSLAERGQSAAAA